MRYFIDGGSPVPPWSLHFVFRNNKASFELSPKYFLKDGKEDLSLFEALAKPPRDMGVPPMKHGQDARATPARKGFCRIF